jgi:hypothetical protein
MAAGPNSLCGSGPNPNLAFEHALTLPGSPDLHYVDPRQFLWLSDSYAAGNNFGSLHSLAGGSRGQFPRLDASGHATYAERQHKFATIMIAERVSDLIQFKPNRS